MKVKQIVIGVIVICLALIGYVIYEINQDTIERRLLERKWTIRNFDRKKYHEFDYFVKQNMVLFEANYTGSINANYFNWRVVDEKNMKIQLSNFENGDRYNGIYDVSYQQLDGCLSGLIMTKGSIRFEFCEWEFRFPEIQRPRIFF